MKLLITLLLLPTATWATETPPAEAPLGAEEREELYEKHNMGYARQLYLQLNGSPEDEVRSQKGDALNFRVRMRGIEQLERRLGQMKDKRLRREMIHRLSQLYEQQADVTSRRAGLKNKEATIEAMLRQSIKYLGLMRKEFPEWTPDAVLFNLAENHAKLKETSVAERYYREVISRFPKSPVVADSLLSLGNVYFERQAFGTARGFFQRMLDTTEANLYPYAHYKMAWCYFNESNFPSAIARLEQAIYESRKLSANSEKKLGVEEEALTDLVLFFAEYGNPDDAKPYFEKLVGRERANELRYNLAQRLFDHGKHFVAKKVAKQLLDENPQKEHVNRLYLILISVAERTKDREFGLNTAAQLAGWLKKENLKKEDTSRVESEEYIRQYSQKLHYEAETMKQKEVWAQAKKSYEIYLEAFPDETETPEVKFRYAVLLMNRKEELKAYQSVNEAVSKMDEKHPRFKEALRLRVQAAELTSPEERKQIADADLLASYDAYARHFPTEELGIEASYKAAGIAKKLETPEAVAARYRQIAEKNPQHNLAKASLGESLAVLVKAQKWDALGQEAKAMSERTELQTSLFDKDPELKKKIGEARELAQVKIAEDLENSGKAELAKTHYQKILEEGPSPTMGVYALVRLAALAEQKLKQSREAISWFEELQRRYPEAKEARPAHLEIARLHEKVNAPRAAVDHYLKFADSGSGKLEIQALTNAAVLLETLGERERAAEGFFRLAEQLRAAKAAEKDQAAAFSAACNNNLVHAYQNRERKTLQRIQDCAKRFAGSQEALAWQARAAWALDQMADALQADAGWQKLAARSLKATPESERAYVAMGKLRLLARDLASFRQMRFAKTNERPEANIGNKTKALEAIEKMVETLVQLGTPKQIAGAQASLRAAYLDFAETMETAAVPSKLNEAEQAELKASFVEFAKGFREKATALDPAQGESRAPASVATEKPEIRIGSLSGSDARLLETGEVPPERAAELYAKRAYASYRDGAYGEANFFLNRWKKEASAEGDYGLGEWEKLSAALAAKMPAGDPLNDEIY